MLVLGAPEELEALVGLFGELYVSTFDCAAVFIDQIADKKPAYQKPKQLPLETETKITILKYNVKSEHCVSPS